MASLKNRRVSDHLNFIRGLMALCVLVTHIRNALYVPYVELTTPSSLVKLLYFVTGLGNEFVMVFFVLSGFLVGSSVYAHLQQDRFSWRDYLASRFARLYVVLLPALLISAAITYVGYVVFLKNSHYPDISVSTFLANSLYLQTIYVHAYAGNLPLWSLSNEFWYYLIFPCLLCAVYQSHGARRYLYLLTAMSLLLFIGKTKASYFLIWLMGFAIYLVKPIPQLKVRSQWRVGLVCLPLLGLLIEGVCSRLHLLPDMALDFMTAMGFSLFLYLILHDERVSKNRSRYVKLATLISSCSYTLYLIHYPIIILIEKFLPAHWQPDLQHVLWGVVIGLLVFGFAFVLSLFTEAKTDTVKAYLLALFTERSASSSPVESVYAAQLPKN